MPLKRLAPQALDRLESTEPRLLLGAELLWADDAVDVLLEAVEVPDTRAPGWCRPRCFFEAMGVLGICGGPRESNRHKKVVVYTTILYINHIPWVHHARAPTSTCGQA